MGHGLPSVTLQITLLMSRRSGVIWFVVTTYRVLCEPSFHLPVEVVVEDREHVAQVTVCGTRRAMSDECRNQFRAAMQKSNPWQLGDVEHTGFDGITLRARVSDGASEHAFTAWSPEQDTQPGHHVFFRAVLVAAIESVGKQERQPLEDALGYLPVVLPFRAYGTAPMILALCASPKLEFVAEFRAFVAGLPSDQPLLVDVDGLGDEHVEYLVVLLELDRRPGRTLWSAAQLTAELLIARGIESRRMFSSLDEARRAVTVPGGVAIRDALHPHLKQVEGVVGYRLELDVLVVMVRSQRLAPRVLEIAARHAPGADVRVEGPP
jgi:hypothetical protein